MFGISEGVGGHAKVEKHALHSADISGQQTQLKLKNNGNSTFINSNLC